MTKSKKIGLYLCLGLTRLAFAAAGVGKLMGVEQLHASFAAMGLPVWFGYFIGASEAAGAIGLWVRKLRTLAAAGLVIIMAGATYFHIFFATVPNAIPAIVLAALLIAVLFISRNKTADLVGEPA